MFGISRTAEGGTFEPLNGFDRIAATCIASSQQALFKINTTVVALWFPPMPAHQRIASRTNHFKIFKHSTNLLCKNFSILV